VFAVSCYVDHFGIAFRRCHRHAYSGSLVSRGRVEVNDSPVLWPLLNESRPRAFKDKRLCLIVLADISRA